MPDKLTRTRWVWLQPPERDHRADQGGDARRHVAWHECDAQASCGDRSTGIWRAEIAPTDTNVWFQNYKAMMLQYAQAGAGNRRADDLHRHRDEEPERRRTIRDKWVDLIDSDPGGLIRSRHLCGDLRRSGSCELLGQGRLYRRRRLCAAHLFATIPRVDEMVRAWTETPVNDYIKDIYGGKSVVEYYKALSEQYGKKMIFTEVGYRVLDGTNKDPGAWGGNDPHRGSAGTARRLRGALQGHDDLWRAMARRSFPVELSPVRKSLNRRASSRRDYTTQGKLANATDHHSLFEPHPRHRPDAQRHGRRRQARRRLP